MTRFFIMMGIVALLLVTSIASVFAQPLEAPMWRGESGHYIIQASVNGQGPFNLAVDTGSVGTIFSAELIEALELSPVPGASENAYAAGGSVRFEFYDVESIGLGEGLLENLRVVGSISSGANIFDEEIQGILGIDVIAEYVPAFLDSFETFRLLPTDTNLAHMTAGWINLEIRTAYGNLVFLDVMINGASAAGVLDTGASRNVMTYAAAQAAGYTDGDARIYDDPNGFNGMDGERMHSSNVDDVEIEWSGTALDPQTVSIADLSVLSQLGLGDEAIIIGSPIFQGRDFVVDYQMNRILLAPKMD